MNRAIYRCLLVLSALVLSAAASGITAGAQPADRKEVRAGNRKFRRDDFRKAEIDYRKALIKDSLSLTAQYNLANTLYRLQDYDGAGKALEAVSGDGNLGSNYYFNAGDVALQKQDYGAAVEAFKQSLLLNPGDIEAKENYIYAKKKLQDQQDQQDQNQDQNQQNQDQNQDQDQQDQDQQDQKISPQQAQQMLKAIQAQEKETQDKVNKEKAEILKSRQKEKNW